LTITFVILRITWQSFQTVRDDPGEGADDEHDERSHADALVADHADR
jgi:hypothetical protein